MESFHRTASPEANIETFRLATQKLEQSVRAIDAAMTERGVQAPPPETLAALEAFDARLSSYVD